jgi:hypothetical protein
MSIGIGIRFPLAFRLTWSVKSNRHASLACIADPGVFRQAISQKNGIESWGASLKRMTANRQRATCQAAKSRRRRAPEQT